MIGLLTGSVSQVVLEKGYLILDVNGVGYIIHTPAELLLSTSLKEQLTLYTYLAVRETALDLYGFKTTDQKELFELLLSVSGVGPKSALSILSIADESTIYTAISTGETSYLTKVSGIGKKLAAKIVLELKDKTSNTGNNTDTTNIEDVSVIEALEVMGYKTQDARKVIKEIPSDAKTLNERVAAALKLINKK